jgi:hypothetical protein
MLKNVCTEAGTLLERTVMERRGDAAAEEEEEEEDPGSKLEQGTGKHSYKMVYINRARIANVSPPIIIMRN